MIILTILFFFFKISLCWFQSKSIFFCMSKNSLEQCSIMNKKEIKCLVASSMAYDANVSQDSIRKTLEGKMKDYHKDFPSIGIDKFQIIDSTRRIISIEDPVNREIIVASRGTNALNDVKQDLMIALGKVPDGTKRLENYVRELAKKYPNHKIFITGHSLGGNNAENTTVNLNKDPLLRGRIECVSFNAGSSSCRQDPNNIPPANITSLKINGDPISKNPLLGNEKKFGDDISRFNAKKRFKAHSLDNFHEIAKASEREIARNQPGGVDFSIGSIPSLNQYPIDLRISGLSFDSYSSLLSSVRSYGDEINIKDLALALLVFYDDTIKCKNLSFSLDPWDANNPYGDFRKVYWPDKEENMQIIEGTEYGDVLFESDYIMKQLSLGLFTDRKIQDVSVKLRKLGLVPIHELGNEGNWMRLWLIIKKVNAEREVNSFKGAKCFNILQAEMGVDARNMEIGSDGRLRDKVIQAENNCACRFAKRFAEIYDKIAEEIPVFRRLKQIAKANTLAKWMWVNQIPVDLDKIRSVALENRRSVSINRINVYHYHQYIWRSELKHL